MSCQASWWGEVYYNTSIPDYNPPSYHSDTCKTSLDTPTRNHSVSEQEEILAIRRRLQNIKNDIREDRQKYKANIPLIWKPKLARHTVDNNKKINTHIWKPKLARHNNLSPTIDNNVINGNAVPIAKPKPKPADTTPTPPIDKPKIKESIVLVVAQIQTANEPAVKMAVTPQTTTSVTGNQAKPPTSARNLVTTIASVLIIAKLTQNGKHYTDNSPRRNVQNALGNIAINSQSTPKHTISEWLFRPPPQPPPLVAANFEPEFYLHRTQCDCEVEIFHHTQCDRQTTPHLPVIEPLKVL